MPKDGNQNNRIVMESSFAEQYLPSVIYVDSNRLSFPPYISEWSFNYQVSKIYGVSGPRKYMNPAIPPLKSLRFYGKPDIELVLADYLSLPEMEEVFFELLPNVSLKKRMSSYEISISDRVDDDPLKLIPTLLIDGVIINDPSMIADLDPETVDRIDVVKEQYLVGDYLFSGIVNVITKSADFSCVPLPDYMVRFPYKVIDRDLSFSAPDYTSSEIRNNHIPDYRNTLYWNPSLTPDRNGKVRIEFWTADVVSEYDIKIQGTDSNGNFLSYKKSLRVK
jgi:hypothetical protein